MVSNEILNQIKNKENCSLDIVHKSDLLHKLEEIVKSASLVLSIEVKIKGDLITNDYYSQICITVYDKDDRSVFLKDETNMSLEVFSDIVIQNKKKIDTFDIDNDVDFWEGIQFLIDNISKENYYIK